VIRSPRHPHPATLALLAALAACGGDGMLLPRAPDFAVLPMRLELAPGDTARLSAQIEQRAAQGVQFLSRGTAASVTATGLVTAVAPGEGAITAVESREGIIYTVPVTVRGVRVRVNGVEPGPAGVRMALGQPAALQASVFGLPRSATDSVRWASSDEAVATIDAGGTLHPRAPGRAVLTAASSADPFLLGTTIVEVTSARTGPALQMELLSGRGDSARAVAPEAVSGTVAVVVHADAATFPAGTRAELSVDGHVVGLRTLSGGGAPTTFTLATVPRDSATGVARIPDGPHTLVLRMLRGGTLAGRIERALVVRNGD
jgi:hypothetical protein